MARHRRFLIPVTALLAALLAAPLQADVKLPSLLSDHMLLQQGKPVRIWGKAGPGEQVKVSFRGQDAAASADASGNWSLFLKPMEAGGPFQMTVEGNNQLTIRDVLVGEVWVGAGQSNMAFSVGRSNDAEQEIASAGYPKIRLFKVALKVGDQPADDAGGSWRICSPKSVKNFSAVAYFFGRGLHKELGVPVGLIQSAWGGTPAESWTRRESLLAEPSLRVLLDEWDTVLKQYPAAKKKHDKDLANWEKASATAKQAGADAPRRPRPPRGPGHHHTPSGLYNAMIAPLTPYAIRGAIWYQGENNAGRSQGYLYRRLFQTMIQNWRDDWGQGSFPFLFVQLANYSRARGEWPELREAQKMALRLRDTGMAVTIDIGEPDDIHPTNKQDVGHRLALAARALAYGQEIVYSGPAYRRMTLEGDRIRLWFDHAGPGLLAKGGELEGFSISGAGRRFVLARAEIDGDTIVVWSGDVNHPVAVRYGWAKDPSCNLYNRGGLPASPFRTDQWSDATMIERDQVSEVRLP